MSLKFIAFSYLKAVDMIRKNGTDRYIVRFFTDKDYPLIGLSSNTFLS